MPGLQYNYTMKLQMHVSCSKQSKHHALHFLYSVRVTRVMALLLYHLGMYNKWYQQNQTGSMNMLSEIWNAPQSPYPVPSLIEKGQYLTEVYFWSVAPNFILE
jgi:hypothetical protein